MSAKRTDYPHAADGFTDFMNGEASAQTHIAEWLRAVHPLQAIGDVRDEVGFTACDALATLIESGTWRPSDTRTDSPEADPNG